MALGSSYKLPKINGFLSRMSIPYRRPYRFGHWYDIFRIPVNTGYHFGFTVIFYINKYIYIYIYVCVCVCVCVCIIINIKVYHKTFPQFRTNYSWFYTLVSIKWEKKKKKIESLKVTIAY